MFKMKYTTPEDLFTTSFYSTNSLEQFEDEKFFIYALKVPYFNKSDLQVTLEKNHLFIKAEKSIYGKKVQLNEDIKIPDPTYSSENIVLQYYDGVLFIKFPKEVKEKQKRTLEIK